jgi:hypothetical protein
MFAGTGVTAGADAARRAPVRQRGRHPLDRDAQQEPAPMRYIEAHHNFATKTWTKW